MDAASVQQRWKIKEVFSELWKKLSDGGVDITPLRNLIHEMVDEEKIRHSGKEFCLLTFSVTDMKELDLSLEDIPEGALEDFLLASAYLLGFKNERLQGKRYIDGGVINNVPLNSLLNRGYKDIITIGSMDREESPGQIFRKTVRFMRSARECGWEVFWNLTAKEAGRI